MTKNKVLLLVVFFWVAACSISAPSREVYCGYELMDTTGWKVWDEGVFRVRLPLDYDLVERGGFDSYGGSWESGDRTVFYDYGSYSNSLTSESLPQSEIQEVCEHGPANSTRLVMYRDTTEAGFESVAAYWKDVLPPDVIPIHLVIIGRVPELDSLRAAEFLTVLASMEVGPPDRDWVGELTPIVGPDGDTLRPGVRE